MEQRDSKSCSFLCFRDCQRNEQPPSTSHPQQFEKLSLKKVKEEQGHVIVRTSSYRRIERPIPTTERSIEEGTEAYLTHLIEKKRKVEKEIDTLNMDFDRYYEMYASKLK